MVSSVRRGFLKGREIRKANNCEFFVLLSRLLLGKKLLLALLWYSYAWRFTICAFSDLIPKVKQLQRTYVCQVRVVHGKTADIRNTFHSKLLSCIFNKASGSICRTLSLTIRPHKLIVTGHLWVFRLNELSWISHIRSKVLCKMWVCRTVIYIFF